ncbi:MAG TPA: ImmA/IrrE family metallo-endopeptidase, partial [Polyangiaceae bacterium]
VIVLGHKLDEPGRVAFVIAHEIAHIAYGDCQPNCPVIEASDDTADDADMETRADAFAHSLLLGVHSVPEIHADDYRGLAEEAIRCETTERIDAGAVIGAWAHKTGDFGLAQRALAALYRNVGAQQAMKRSFEAFVDIENATDSDRDLLRCVVGDPEDDTATD